MNTVAANLRDDSVKQSRTLLSVWQLFALQAIYDIYSQEAVCSGETRNSLEFYSKNVLWFSFFLSILPFLSPPFLLSSFPSFFLSTKTATNSMNSEFGS